MNFKKIHPWNVSPKQAINIQNNLKRKMEPTLAISHRFPKGGILKRPKFIRTPLRCGFRPRSIKLSRMQLTKEVVLRDPEETPKKLLHSGKKYAQTPKIIAGADVAFQNNQALGAIAVMSYPEFKIIECVRRVNRITYPYIPGLLTFREGPVLERCFRVLKNKPDIIIFDGQGIAHPRNMGIATHIGILLDRPTIGCAKTWLWGDYVEPAKSRGAFSYLLDKSKRKIGAVLRTKDNVKPVYVSPGHKMDINSSIRIILMCTKKYRLPEPIRIAHQLTQKRL